MTPEEPLPTEELPCVALLLDAAVDVEEPGAEELVPTDELATNDVPPLNAPELLSTELERAELELELESMEELCVALPATEDAPALDDGALELDAAEKEVPLPTCPPLADAELPTPLDPPLLLVDSEVPLPCVHPSAPAHSAVRTAATNPHARVTFHPLFKMRGP